MPSAHSGCVCLHLCVSVVRTHVVCTSVCVFVCVPYVIKGSEQRRPGARRVMQSTKAKEKTRGRQEGREGREEGGIVASGDPALQECADGHVPHSWGECCILGNSAEVTLPVLECYRLQTDDRNHTLKRDRLCESLLFIFRGTTIISLCKLASFTSGWRPKSTLTQQQRRSILVQATQCPQAPTQAWWVK